MVTIDPSAYIHTLLNTFIVQPERQAALVECLRRFTEQHTHSLSGYVGVAVHASLDGTRVVNYAKWQTAVDLARMLETPEAKNHLAEVNALAESVHPVLYRVAFVHPA